MRLASPEEISKSQSSSAYSPSKEDCQEDCMASTGTSGFNQDCQGHPASTRSRGHHRTLSDQRFAVPKPSNSSFPPLPNRQVDDGVCVGYQVRPVTGRGSSPSKPLTAQTGSVSPVLEDKHSLDSPNASTKAYDESNISDRTKLMFVPCKRRCASTGHGDVFRPQVGLNKAERGILKFSLPAQIDKPDKHLDRQLTCKSGFNDGPSYPPVSTDIESLEMYQLETQPEVTLCGLGTCRPKWLQRFATKRWVLFWLIWFCTVQGMLVNGLVPSVISTIERRFDFTGVILGRIMQFYDIAYVLCCIPVSYFGGRHSKPLYLGVGLMFLSFGAFLFSVPHFFSETYTYKSDPRSIGTCLGVPFSSMSGLSESEMLPGAHYSALVQQSETTTTTTTQIKAMCASDLDTNTTANHGFIRQHVSDRTFYAVLFCIAHFLHGIGSTSLYTLGVSYIDENVKPQTSSMYLGIFYSFAILGPALGFFLSAGFLRFHTDYFSFQKQIGVMEIDESDPEWIGAWWMGFLITSFLAFLAVIPVLSFPRVLPETFYRTRPRRLLMLERAVEYHKNRILSSVERQLGSSSGALGTTAATDNSSAPDLENESVFMGSTTSQIKTTTVGDPGEDEAESSFGHRTQVADHAQYGGPTMAPRDQFEPTSTVPNVQDPLLAAVADEHGRPVPPVKVTLSKKYSTRSNKSTRSDRSRSPRSRSRRPSIVEKAYNDVRGIPYAMYHLLTNKCFLFINLAGAIDGLLVTGFSSFMAKYLERQFSVPSSKANMLIGLIVVPSAGIGTMASGYIVARYRLNCVRTLKFAISVCALALVLSPMFLVYCDPVKMAGVQRPYPGESDDNRDNSSSSVSFYTSIMNYWYGDSAKTYNLTGAKCNSHCSCFEKEYHPVCGEVGGQPYTFFSSCYAGCPDDYHPSTKTYYNCSCANNKQVQRGWCESNCPYLTVFLILFTPMCLFTFSVGVPAMSVILRCVDYHERSFALGIQWILIRCIGTIPAPALFGWLFDQSCLKNHENPCDPAQSGKCFAYDNKKLSNLFLVFALLCQSVTLVFLVLATISYKRRNNRDDRSKAESIGGLG